MHYQITLLNATLAQSWIKPPTGVLRQLMTDVYVCTKRNPLKRRALKSWPQKWTFHQITNNVAIACIHFHRSCKNLSDKVSNNVPPVIASVEEMSSIPLLHYSESVCSSGTEPFLMSDKALITLGIHFHWLAWYQLDTVQLG